MSKVQKIILFTIALLAIFLFFATVWPLTADYAYVFWPVVKSFLAGETRLYDELSKGFYNAPWTIFILLPIRILPIKYGQALLLTAQLIGILVALDFFIEKRDKRTDLIIILLALANMHTFGLVASGNLDGFLAFGIVASWIGAKKEKPFLLGAGLWLLSIKPINILFLIPVLLKRIWHWSTKDKLLSLSPLLASFVISLPVFGYDWFFRYFNALSSAPPNIKPQTSLWRFLSFVGIEADLAKWLFLLAGVLFAFFIARSKSVNKNTVNLALSSNMTFSTYTLGNHYVLLAPAFAVLAQKYPWMTSLWFLTFTPLIRLIWGFKVAWMDIVYPLSIMICTIYMIRKEGRRKEESALPSINLS